MSPTPILPFPLYEVGGCVRDSLLGRPSKDVDFVVVAPSFGAMTAALKDADFRLYQVKPEFFTVRAGVPEGSPLRAAARDADFVWAASLEANLARRDFTVNAIARDVATGEIFDPHGGVLDLRSKTLSFVGNPYQRIREDGLRVLRAVRFMLTHDFAPDSSIWDAMRSRDAIEALAAVAADRRREELAKIFAAGTIPALRMIYYALSVDAQAAAFDGISLVPSQGAVK